MSISQPPKSNLLQVALDYLGRGWAVIPVYWRNPDGSCSCTNPSCEHPGKHPLIEWKEYQQRHPTEDEVHRWWNQWPKAHIGVVCGAVSGRLAVFDVDDVALVSRVIEEKLPTPIERSPRGGVHIFLIERTASRSGSLIGGVADLKADGGFVVVAPSPGYELIQDGTPLVVPNAKEWALTSLKRWGIDVEEPSASGKTYEILKHRPLKQGERDETLLSLGGLLWHKGFPSEVIEAALVGVNQNLCHPPLSIQGSEGIQKIVRSVTSYPRNSISPPPLHASGEVELQPIILATLEEPGERTQIVQGFIPQGCPSLLYGDGGQGKSLLALAMAICIATGKSFLNLPVQRTKVLYLDWELDQEEQTRRSYKVARGLGFDRIPEGLLYLRMEHSISKCLEPLRHVISQNDIGFVLIDSSGPACEGDPEQAKFIIPLMNELRRLNTTLLIIDHQAKLQEGQTYSHKSPFGSTYKFNLARSVLQLQRVGGEKGRVQLLLRHTKSNLGPLQEPIPIQLTFEPRVVHIELADPTDPVFTAELKAWEKVEKTLRENGPGTAADLAERIGIVEGTVTNAITKLKNQGKVVIQGKDGRAPIYAVANSTSPSTNNTNGEMEKGLQSDGPR